MRRVICRGLQGSAGRAGRTASRTAARRGPALRRAALCRAVLRSAALCRAVLRSAALRRAVLRHAVLRHAVLRRAVLRHAVLRGAVLRGAAPRSGSGQRAAGSGAVSASILLPRLPIGNHAYRSDCHHVSR
ncbi:pentapeptide repeat-containing protein [Streptomyces anulatus]|uniref:pentapeptide repeat-containing protein n=1 Tax=Streptomyces anulatus TaxID=1892 RepID=UPI00398CD793